MSRSSGNKLGTDYKAAGKDYIMKGSITGLLRKQGCGFILGEDGCEIFFGRSALNGMEFTALSVGQWVDFELQYGFERLRAANIRPLQEEGRRQTTFRDSQVERIISKP
jgi:cold shock CspA family protein